MQACSTGMQIMQNLMRQVSWEYEAREGGGWSWLEWFRIISYLAKSQSVTMVMTPKWGKFKAAAAPLGRYFSGNVYYQDHRPVWTWGSCRSCLGILPDPIYWTNGIFPQSVCETSQVITHSVWDRPCLVYLADFI